VGWQALLQNGLRELQVCKYVSREILQWNSLHIFFIYDLAHDIPDRLFSSAEALFRRTGSGSGHNREHTKHRSLLESLIPSKAVDSDRTRPSSSSRNGSTSRRAVLSSSKPSSSGDPSDPNRTGRSRPSTTAQRAHYLGGAEIRSSSLSKIGRSSHDDAVRNFELLSIGADRRK
jgi:casein kinase 1 epsilon